METYLQPREVVLDFGLLPLQVLCPQLDTVAGVQAAHRSLSALAATGEDGKKYVPCSSVAAVLDLPEQQCRLLLETLAAVSSSAGQHRGPQQQPQQQATSDVANLHDLSLFLMAQIYAREAHRPETQDHWPEPSTSGSGGQLEVMRAAGSRLGQPGSPSAAATSRALIKAQLAALQRQHVAHSRGYAEFLERHQRVLLAIILDDASGIDAWQQQRAAHKAAHLQLLQQQQQQQHTPQQQQQQQGLTGPAGGDSEMTPVEDAAAPAPAPAAAGQAAAAGELSAMDVQQEAQQLQQQPSGGDDGAGMALSPKRFKAPEGPAGGSPFGGALQQLQQQPGGAGGAPVAAADKAASLGSSGSLASLGGTSSSSSFPPVSVSASEFDRLAFLLEAVRVSKATLAAILESSAAAASSSGGAGTALGGASSRSLFSDLRVSPGNDADAAGSSSSSGGAGGARQLSSYVPGYAAGGSLSMEEVATWMSGTWLHKMQQAAAQQAKASMAAAAGGLGVSPLLQQPAFGSSPAAAGGGAAGPAEGAAGGGALGAKASGSGVASMLHDLSAASGGSSGVAGWLGMAGSPPNTTAQQLSVLASPGGLAASGPGATGAGGFGSFIGGINGVPVVTSVSTGGPSPLTPQQPPNATASPVPTSAAAAGLAGAAPPPGTSPVTGFGFQPAPGTAGSSPAGVAGLLSSGPSGLNSIRVNTTRGMVAIAGGCVDDAGVMGVYRGTVVRGPSDVAADGCFTIQDCSEAHIYVLAPVKLVRIVNCTDCNICVGAVSTLLRVERCERLQLTAAAGQVLVVSCHSCCLHLGTPRMPAILGDCRFVKLAPYNTRYEALYQHLAAAGISPGKASLWDVPLIMTSAANSSHSGAGGGSSAGGSSSRGNSSAGGGSAVAQPGSDGGSAAAAMLQRRPGAATPSSPHTHGGSTERRGGAITPKPVLMMPPDEFFPLVVPFRGTPGPLAGGAAHHASTHWQPNSHRATQGPLPPFPFPLPPEYDAALQQQYGVVTELRSKIKGSGLDDGRRAQLQNVIQSYFREWLHNSGAIRQVYDLSKLEGDELAGGSPHAMRDTTSL